MAPVFPGCPGAPSAPGIPGNLFEKKYNLK